MTARPTGHGDALRVASRSPEQGLEPVDHVHSLVSVIREYTAADIEATIALYEADVGRGYVPTYTRSD